MLHVEPVRNKFLFSSTRTAMAHQVCIWLPCLETLNVLHFCSTLDTKSIVWTAMDGLPFFMLTSKLMRAVF